MLKPRPPLSRFRRRGQAARRRGGVVWCGWGGEGCAGLGLKLIPEYMNTIFSDDLGTFPSPLSPPSSSLLLPLLPSPSLPFSLSLLLPLPSPPSPFSSSPLSSLSLSLLSPLSSLYLSIPSLSLLSFSPFSFLPLSPLSPPLARFDTTAPSSSPLPTLNVVRTSTLGIPPFPPSFLPSLSLLSSLSFSSSPPPFLPHPRLRRKFDNARINFVIRVSAPR